MKSFLSRIGSRLKTKRTARAPCDCRDFHAAIPAAPSVDYLRKVVHERQFRNAPADEALTEDVFAQRDHTVRSIAFDLQFRCGGGGRCTCEGAPACRFPTCFSMRPVIKGAEIQAERYAFEVEDAPTPEIRALVTLARDQKLDEAIVGIRRLVERLLKTAAGGQPLDPAFNVASDLAAEGFVPGTVRPGHGGQRATVNPLRDSAELREEVLSLYIWRAALLVTLRRDDEAVHSLLNLAALVDVQDRTRLYGTAAGWACLHDMEVVYYRSVLRQFETYPEGVFFAHERPMLLPRLFEVMKDDAYHTEYCTHVVFSKEVTATVSRAQAAQMYGDVSEDPMLSLCIPLSVHYYRFRVSEPFWQHFLTLLCMPPVPAPETDERASGDPATELGLTPSHILDAVGRSMLLHHLVLFADTREKEIDSGAVATRVKRMREIGEEVHRSDWDHVMEDRAMSIAIGRMKQLLMVVKAHEETQRANLAGGQAPPRGHLD